jgi:hypothetical protein
MTEKNIFLFPTLCLSNNFSAEIVRQSKLAYPGESYAPFNMLECSAQFW